MKSEPLVRSFTPIISTKPEVKVSLPSIPGYDTGEHMPKYMQFYQRFKSGLSNSREMDWKGFFDTRNKLKIIKRIAGAPSIVGFWIAESSLLSLPVFNPTWVMKYVDPIIAVGGCTIIGSICAYMIGGAISEQAWRWFNPNRAAELDLVHFVSCIRQLTID